MEFYNEVVPRIHHIIEFPELKFENLLGVLQNIYRTEGILQKIVVLTARDYTAKIITEILHHYQIRVTTFCGSRKPKRKRRATYGFNSGKFQVMVVSESGLEAETGEIYHFINFDMNLPYPLNRNSIRNRRHG